MNATIFIPLIFILFLNPTIVFSQNWEPGVLIFQNDTLIVSKMPSGLLKIRNSRNHLQNSKLSFPPCLHDISDRPYTVDSKDKVIGFLENLLESKNNNISTEASIHIWFYFDGRGKVKEVEFLIMGYAPYVPEDLINLENYLIESINFIIFQDCIKDDDIIREGLFINLGSNKN